MDKLIYRRTRREEENPKILYNRLDDRLKKSRRNDIINDDIIMYGKRKSIKNRSRNQLRQSRNRRERI